MKPCVKALILVLLLALSILLPAQGAWAEGIVSFEPEQFSVGQSDEKERAELAEGYINRLLYPSGKKGGTRGAVSVGDRLTGKEAIVYQAIREGVAEMLAGERAATVFQIPVEEMFPQLTYTAQDLGLDSLVSNGTLSEEARSAVRRLMSVDLRAVINALLMDCPYEMFWYDKTEGCSLRNPLFGWNSTSIALMGYTEISMSVGEEYQPEDGDAYTFNVQYGLAAQAAENAQALVDQYAGRSDVDKLFGYKDAICELVAYNHAVWGQSGPLVSYGNPWQLIWVFDNDPNTDVVCEGYCKAFQYLCDLTAFQNDISVLTIEGYTSGGTIMGDHMWNIVRMEDGKNYLADVTNCDKGTSGYPDALFLVGHVSGDVESGYTFSANGNALTYQYDTDVKNYLSAEELTISDDAYSLSAKFEYTVSDGAITLTQYIGPYRRVTIPATYNGCTITAIGSAAFNGCETLESVTLPESLRSIGQNAFRRCTSLLELTIPDGVTFIGANAFQLCGGILLHTSLGSEALRYALANHVRYLVQGDMFTPDFVLPSATVTIADHAFKGIAAQKVRLPEGVESIGEMAFANCPDLQCIYIPGAAEDIDPDAFSGVEGLVIYGGADSYAREYAAQQSIAYVVISGEE